MTHYRPILKGNRGELRAWGHASPAVQRASSPLFEVVGAGRPRADVDLFLDLVAREWSGDVLSYDTSALAQGTVSGPAGPALHVARQLHERGVAARPTVRQHKSDAALDQVRQAVELHGRGAVLRVGSPTADPDPEKLEQETPRLLDRMGLEQGDVDLVLELWALAVPRDVRRAAYVADDVVAWTRKGAWRSVTVVAGSFPKSIADLEPGEANELPRREVEMWRRMTERTGIDVGDYGVNHPASAPAGEQGDGNPLPAVRYTAGETWQVFREARWRPGNESFYTLCAKVVGAPFWAGQDFSWGDEQIARRAEESAGSGTPSDWRAFGTSHHVAVVVDRLGSVETP